MLNSYELAFIEETNYLAQSIQGTNVQEIYGNSGRRFFFFLLKILINYMTTIDQIKKAKNLLENMTKGKNLDPSYDLSLLTNDIRQIDNSKNHIFLPSLEKVTKENITTSSTKWMDEIHVLVKFGGPL